MIAEAEIGGVLMAPIVIYVAVALAIFAVLRAILGRVGLIGHLWHPALFEVALFSVILSLLILYV